MLSSLKKKSSDHTQLSIQSSYLLRLNIAANFFVNKIDFLCIRILVVRISFYRHFGDGSQCDE